MSLIATVRDLLKRPGEMVISKTWYGLPLFHGPHHWPFWKPFVIRTSGVVYVREPSVALRIWLYTRKGSGFIQFHKDRSKP